MNILAKFPRPYDPTPLQVETLNRLGKVLDNKDKKFVIIQAPTGTGKSFISRTLGNTTKEPSEDYKELVRSYDAFKRNGTGLANEEQILAEKPFGCTVLTITKTLQDQYEDLFMETDVFKGKSNYQCSIDETKDVEIAVCRVAKNQRTQCWKEKCCAYYEARNEAILSTFSCLNYKVFLTLPYQFKRKSVIVCDEASELEDEIIRMFSATITYDKLEKLGVKVVKLASDSPARAKEWLKTLANDLESQIEFYLKNKVKAKVIDPDQAKAKGLQKTFDSISSVIKHWDEVPYIIEKNAQKVIFTPSLASGLSRHIFDHADRIVLLSATIIDHKRFARSLGIADYEFIDVDSTFDSKNAPIHVAPQIKLNKDNLVSSMGTINKIIEEIVNQHKDDKGLIHTHSHQITSLVKEHFINKTKRFLYREQGLENHEMLTLHKETGDPTVLVSPSMAFGVDLPDDLARFQIIIKLPYPSLGDKRIKYMFDNDRQWYVNKMLTYLVQACGRGIRHQEDHCTTYILDGNVVNVLRDQGKVLPGYFVDRFV